MKHNGYDTKKMSNELLWQCVLTPIEKRMPENLRAFLKEAEKEFHSRGIKLYPICR